MGRVTSFSFGDNVSDRPKRAGQIVRKAIFQILLEITLVGLAGFEIYLRRSTTWVLWGICFLAFVMTIFHLERSWATKSKLTLKIKRDSDVAVWDDTVSARNLICAFQMFNLMATTIVFTVVVHHLGFIFFGTVCTLMVSGFLAYRTTKTIREKLY